MFKIHERIKNERVAARLTEDEMAEKLQIPRSTYQYWEKTDPSIDKIKLVAKALGKNEDYFFINNDEIGAVHEDPDDYNKVLPLGDLKITIKDYVDLLKEKVRKAEERELKLFALLERDIITLKTNSDAILNGLERVERLTRADDLSMMEGTDKILGREPGTTSLEAGIVEHALEDPDGHVDTNVSTRNEGNVGKGRQKGKA